MRESQHPIDYYDRIAALYWFCADYHQGQWSALYRLLCIVGRFYQPGPLHKGYESLSDDGKAYYHHLREKGIV